MRFFLPLLVFSVLTIPAAAQGPAQTVFETEKAFEKMVADKGIKAAFSEFMAPTGIIFRPAPVNARASWASRPDSPALLTWNPVWIEVSSNELLAYSIGNSIFRPKGKDDTDPYYGHYLSIWAKQPSGGYRASLDAGISHEKWPMSTNWTTPSNVTDKNEGRLSAADSTTGFWKAVETAGSVKAYKDYLADDAVLMRAGKPPYFGKKAAVAYLDSQQPRIKFPRRKAFIETADLAYVYDTYQLMDKAGTEIERGNFVQVWKLRKGKWLIAADLWIVIPRT